jgi:hypothetical protein
VKEGAGSAQRFNVLNQSAAVRSEFHLERALAFRCDRRGGFAAGNRIYFDHFLDGILAG